MDNEFDLGAELAGVRESLPGEGGADEGQPEGGRGFQPLLEGEPEPDRTFSDFDERLSEMQTRAERREAALVRHIEHLTSRLEPPAEEPPAAPDREEAPISYVQHGLDQVNARLDALAEGMETNRTEESQRAYANELSTWIETSESMVANPNSGPDIYEPAYDQAVNFLHDSQFRAWKYANPGVPEAELHGQFMDWYTNWADGIRKGGEFLPNVIWNWAVESGFIPVYEDAGDAGEAGQGGDNVADFGARKEEMAALQVPDIGSGGYRSEGRASDPQELEDLSTEKMSDTEYAQWMETQGGLGGVLRRIKALKEAG